MHTFPTCVPMKVVSGMATPFHGEGFIISSNNISPVIYPLQNKFFHFPSHSGYGSHLQILQITTLKGFGKQPPYSNHQKALFTFHFLKESSQRKHFLLLESEARRSCKSPVLILWKACQSLFQIESLCPKCWYPCNLIKEWMHVDMFQMRIPPWAVPLHLHAWKRRDITGANC